MPAAPVIGLFVVGLIELALAGIVWRRQPQQSVNRWFAIFATTLAVWSVLLGVRRLVVDPSVILILVRAIFAVAAVIPVTFFRFAMVFPRPGPVNPALAQSITVVGLFISGLAFSPWVVARIQPQPELPQPGYGPLHPFFIVYFVTCAGWALVHLAGKRHEATGFARVQIHYLFVGTGLACLGGVITNFLVPLLFGTSRFSLYGPYFTLIWLGFTAHVIIRYRLMDIRVAISRTAAYAAGWFLICGSLVVGAVLLDVVTPFSPTLSPAGAVLLGLLASLAFIGLAPHIKALADRYLYRPAYDPRQLAREGTRAMATLGDPQRVASAMAKLIGAAVQPESLAIVVWNRERAAYQAAYAGHMDAAFAEPREALTGASPLARMLRATLGTLVADDLAQHPPSREMAAVAADLRAWRAEVAVPVHGEGELIAIVLIGPRRSGDPFFREDLDLLDTLASQLAIGLQNAQLYQEIVAIKDYNERILARMDSGVAAVRDDGVVTTFNAAAEQITGLGVMQALGQSLERLDPALRGVLRSSLAGQPDTEAEITVRHADGRTLPLVTHTSALHDRSGHIRGAIAVFNDHSRLKALEEDKRRADRLAAIGALATGIAHEIRNPLVAIKTFAELLPERADDQEFRSTFAKVAAKEVHRIEELLGRLRALAVPAVARLHPLDLQGPLAETLDLIRGEADRRGVRVVTEIEPDLPPIVGEADQLKQLFLNVFLNGLDAMAGGGTLSVTVRVDRERPERAAKAPSGLVTVRVADTGPGIPRDDLARIFEPFFTTKSQGTGLGLAICRGIADAHRAALWAEPGPAGVGTAFVVQFPAHAGAAVVHALR